MFCLQCGTENVEDSKYCKECGALVGSPVGTNVRGLPVRSRLSPHIAEDLGADDGGNSQLRRLTELALWHSQAGNVPAAILSCETALLIEPDNATALSLLGCLYERQGQIDQAIAMFERVVQISPESIADVKKLDALKRGQFLPPVPQPLGYRWLPPVVASSFAQSAALRAGAGIAAGLLVIGLGGALILSHGSSSNAPAQQSSHAAIPTPFQFRNNGSVPIQNQSAVVATPFVATPVTIVPASSQAIAHEAAPTATTAPLVPTASISRVPKPPKTANQQRVPPLAVAVSGNASVPLISSIKPLDTKSARLFSGDSLPQHTLVIGSEQEEAASGGGRDAGSGQSSDGGDSNAPALPAPHVYVHVHPDQLPAPIPITQAAVVPVSQPSEAAPAPSAGIASRGASLQSQALQAQQRGNYKAASGLYRSAINAYRGEMNRGEFVSEAQRGIDACETGLQICQANS